MRQPLGTIMNSYGDDQAYLNDLLYPISAAYEQGLADLLMRESDGDRVVELGVGTGRVALPLATRGFNLIGVDLSESMLKELSRRDSFGAIKCIRADFTIPIEALPAHQTDAVLLMCNTIFEASDSPSQRNVFANARRLLTPEGVFVVETINPLLLLSRSESRVDLRTISADSYLLEKTEVDRLTQKATTLFLILTKDEDPLSYRQTMQLMTPKEMDSIAAGEGMSLRLRMSGWNGESVSDNSPQLISVYERDDF